MQRQLCLDPRQAVPGASDMSRVEPKRDLRLWFCLTHAKQLPNDHDKSPTCPFCVVVPKAASDELLEKAMAARPRARFPAVSFVRLGSGAVLARSSQPLRKSPEVQQDSDLCYMLTNGGYDTHNAKPKCETLATIASTVISFA